jgi:hypothetical protein
MLTTLYIKTMLIYIKTIRIRNAYSIYVIFITFITTYLVSLVIILM